MSWWCCENYTCGSVFWWLLLSYNVDRVKFVHWEFVEILVGLSVHFLVQSITHLLSSCCRKFRELVAIHACCTGCFHCSYNVGSCCNWGLQENKAAVLWIQTSICCKVKPVLLQRYYMHSVEREGRGGGGAKYILYTMANLNDWSCVNRVIFEFILGDCHVFCSLNDNMQSYDLFLVFFS